MLTHPFGIKLIITGNSTSLAPWDVKLGWVKHPFVAALGTLTSAGGVAPLLDLIVERAFPCGYIDMSKYRSLTSQSGIVLNLPLIVHFVSEERESGG